MGVIEDVYEDLESDVPLEEFRAAVEEKVEQMGGLADEETAAMLIAHDLRDEEVSGIADIEPGMDEVKFLGKVVSIGDVRTFERDGEDEPDGRVCNVEVADETGRIRISLWDEAADAVETQLEVGQVLRIAGRPTDGYDGVEVSVNTVEPDEDAEVEVEVLDTYRVEDLALGRSDVDLVGKVLDTDSVRTFDRDDGSEGKVANLTLGDETGRVRVTLWDEQATLAEEFDPGETVEVVDGYVRERDGDLELHVGSRGDVERVDEDVEYVPETTDIADLEIDQRADIAGGVVETDPKRTFDRDDGSQGQVRNVRIKDETGEIRVALWGEKADADVDLADLLLVTDAEIQDGWQDDLEASANWRSTVTVLDEEPAAGDATAGGSSVSETRAAAGDAGGSGGGSAGGLSAFADGEATSAGATDGKTEAAPDGAANGTGAAGGGGTDAVAEGGTDAVAEGGTDAVAEGGTDAVAEGGTDAGTDAADTVEFTGTVVQAGNPVVLDDGRTTRNVETDETLRLGEEVTVRGEERNGTIDADEVF